MIHERSTALEHSVKYFTGGGGGGKGGFKPVPRRASLTLSSDVDQEIDVGFQNSNLSRHNLLEHINQDIKRRYSKNKDSTNHKTEY